MRCPRVENEKKKFNAFLIFSCIGVFWIVPSGLMREEGDRKDQEFLGRDRNFELPIF